MLTSQQKNDLQNLIRNLLHDAGDPNGVKTATLPKKIKDELQIDWREHRQADEGFEIWLGNTLPEILFDGHYTRFSIATAAIDGSVNMSSQSVLQAVPADICRQVVEIVTSTPDCKVFMVQRQLEQRNILFTDYPNGDSSHHFPVWLKRIPGIVVRGYLVSIANVESASELDLDTKKEITRMSQEIWFGPWTDFYKEMNSLTGQNHKDYWRALVAHSYQLACTMQCHPYMYETVSKDGLPTRRVFRLNDLYDAKGRQLYAVLEAAEGQIRPWRLLEVVYPGKLGTKTGPWLCRTFGIRSEETSIVTVSEEVQEMVGHFHEIEEIYSRAVQRLSESVKVGLPLDEQDLQWLLSYHQQRNTLEELLTQLTGTDLTGKPLEDIDAYFNGTSFMRITLGHLLELLRNIHQALKNEIKECRILSEETEAVFAQHTAVLDNCSVCPTESLGWSQYDELTTIAQRYDLLIRLSFFTDVNTEADSLIDQAQEAFFISPRNVARMICENKIISELQPTMQEVQAELLAMRNALDGVTKTEHALQESQLSLSQENKMALLQRILSDDESIRPQRQDIYEYFPALNKLEEQIVLANFESAQNIAEDAELMEQLGYSEQEIITIQNNLDAEYVQAFSRSAAPLACGNRLYDILGTQSLQAEKFYLADMPSPDAFAALLNLYRWKKQQQAFIYLMEHLRGEATRDDWNYLIACYAQADDVESITRLLTNKPELLYQGSSEIRNCDLLTPECAPKDETWTNILQTVQNAVKLAADVQLSDAAKAILGNDTDALRQILTSSPSSLNLSMDEANRWLRDLSDYPKTDAFSIALRLHRLLDGEFSCLAEQLMWDALLPSQLQYQLGECILPLLGSQQRYDEIILLYRAYETVLSTIRNCRLLYLKALCASYTGYANDISQYARTHLIDALQQLQVLHNTKLSITDPELMDILLLLDEICRTSEYAEAVVHDNSALETFILQPDHLMKLDFTSQQIDLVTSRYKSGIYSRGQDTYAVASRVYFFLHNNAGLAEKLVRFAVRSNQQSSENRAAELLLHILIKENRWTEARSLFAEITWLIEKKPDSWLQTVIRCGLFDEYDDIPEVAKAKLDPAYRQSVENLIALHRTDITEERALVVMRFTPDHIADALSLFVPLMHTFCVRGWDQAISMYAQQAILPMLDSLSTKEIERLITGNGALSDENLSHIQGLLLNTPHTEALSIYMSRVLHMCHVENDGNDFFDRMLVRLAEPGVFALLSRLYPERMDFIQSQRCINELQVCLNKGFSIDALHDFIVEKQLVIQDWSLVLDLLTKAALPIRNILADVLPVLQPTEVQLRVFHAIWQPDDENATLTVAEAELLFALLEKNSLEVEELPQLQILCENAMRNKRSLQFACCLYLIYCQQKLEDLAELALVHVLSSCTKEPIPAALLKNPLSREDAAGICPLLKLFRKTVMSVPLEQVTDTVTAHLTQMQGLFLPPMPADHEWLKSNLRNDNDLVSGSDTNCERLLRILYWLPTEENAWRMLPILNRADYEGLNLRLLMLRAEKINRDFAWKNLIHSLLNLGENHLLPMILIRQLRHVSGGMHIGAQKMVVSCLDTLAALPESQQQSVRSLVQELCRSLRQDDTLHVALVNLADVAITLHCNDIVFESDTARSALRSEKGCNAMVSYAYRLLLAGEIEMAQELLQETLGLSGLVANLPLCKELSDMDQDVLKQWMADGSNRMLLNMLLPNNNRPTYEELMNRLVWPALAEADVSSCQRAANVLMRLMDLYSPNRAVSDNAQCLALYLLVKSSPPFSGRECCLQRALYLLNITTGAFSFRAGRYSVNSDADHAINRRWQQNDLILANWLVQQNNSQLHESNVNDLLISRSPENQAELADRTRMIHQLLADMMPADAREAVWARLTGNWAEIMLRCFRSGDALDSNRFALMQLEPGRANPFGLFRSLMQAYARIDDVDECLRYYTWLDNTSEELASNHSVNNGIERVFSNAARFLKEYYLTPNVSIQVDVDLLSMPLDELNQADKLIVTALNAPVRLDKVRRLVMVGLSTYDTKTMYFNTANVSFSDAASRLMAVERLLKDFHIPHPVSVTGVITQVFDSQLAARSLFFRAMDSNDDTSFSISLGRAANVLLDWASNTMFYCDNRLSMEERIRNLATVIVRLSGAEESQANYLLHLYELLCKLKQTGVSMQLLDTMVRQRQSSVEKFIDYTVLKLTHQGEASIFFKAQSDEFLGQCSDFIAARRDIPVPIVSTDCLRAAVEEARSAHLLRQKKETTETYSAETEWQPWEEPAFVRELCGEQENCGNDEVIDEQTITEDYVHWRTVEKTADPKERTQILEHCCHLSLIMYVCARQKKNSALAQEACFRFCFDHWAYLNHTLHSDPALRSKRIAPVLMEMSLLATQCRRDFEVSQWYQSKLITAFYDLISGIRDLDTLFSLLNSHTTTLRKLSVWTEELGRSRDDTRWSSNPTDLTDLLLDLENLCVIYRTHSDNDHQLAEELSAILERFHVISYDQNRACNNMQLYVKNLIATRLNQLYDRPNLQIRLLNKDHRVSYKDSIFGIVYNHGKQPARNVILRVLAKNGIDLSMTAQLNILRPDSSAPFALPFTLPSHVKQLQVVLTVEYEFEGVTDRSTLPENQLLDVTLPPRVSLPVTPYPTITINDFRLDENNEIVSDMLVGRDYEKKALRALATGGFSQYRNAFVRGVRRSGKSSLLNYLRYHISECQEDRSIRPIYTSLQDCSTSQVVQFAFISSVIKAVRVAYPQIALTDDWTLFEKRWELSLESEDRSLDEIPAFYAQFSHVTGGQRIVLILDEFDKILERIAGDPAAQAHFFKQLDAILTNVELQKYVRFIFCGSNYLLRCSMDGGVMHQVFQRADTIEVGHLSEADMRTMLIKPTLESGVTFHFTEEALSYFYRIFQGSIWSVRLIGQKIVDELRKIGRSTVYPSDVYEYVRYVLDPKDKCQQFTEGCEQNERRVLRAIHYYTTHQNASVSIAEIQERLQANGDRLDPASLGTSLSLLRQLKLVEEDNMSTSGKRYRFAGELYRIFFSVLFDSEYANDTLPYDDMTFLRDEKEDLLIRGENAHGQPAAFAGLLLLDDEDDECPM